MTIDECVRALMMKLEPGIIETAQAFPMQVSPLGFWIPILCNFGAAWRWEPANPLTYAECSERLLEAMPAANLCRHPTDGLYYVHANCLSSMLVSHKNIRMAIFLAALKWQGIEEPTV